MKRREMKFVAGSAQLAPDRIQAVPRPRTTAAPARKGRRPTEPALSPPAGVTRTRKRR